MDQIAEEKRAKNIAIGFAIAGWLLFAVSLVKSTRLGDLIHQLISKAPDTKVDPLVSG